jgi:HAD superfamily hydrolase (TIGR01509 family)
MRAVLFDLGNTLVSYYTASDFAPILRKCLDACLETLTLDVRVDEAELSQLALTLNVERADYAVWPLVERLRVLFGEAACTPAVQESLEKAFLGPILATAIVDPEALSVLASLRARELRLAIVSNTPWGSPGHLWRTELQRHGLLDAIDAAVFCSDVGYRKPHPAPIERALSMLEVSPSDAVFVGDDPHWDVVGAEQAGVLPILIRRPPNAPTTLNVATITGLRELLDYRL